MISDTLHDAIAEIERYTTDPVFAPSYAALATQTKIAATVAAMRGLLEHLDAPPVATGPGRPPSRSELLDAAARTIAPGLASGDPCPVDLALAAT